MENVKYAGFWKRFLAMIIDAILLGILNTIVACIFFGLMGMEILYSISEIVNFDNDRQSVAAIFHVLAVFAGYIIIVSLVTTVISWLYYAFMESSSKQATIGKMALSLKVTDLNGSTISFGKATGRYFAKIISALILYIGYIIAAFTPKKQALHDMLAGCVIIDESK